MQHVLPNDHNQDASNGEGWTPRHRPSFPARELEYDLPEELIAQTPAERRTDARLLVVHRDTGKLEDRGIPALTEYLRAGDALVLNDTRVLPAKFELVRASGGRIEGLYLSTDAQGHWEVLLRGAKRIDIGEELTFINQGPPRAEAATGDPVGAWSVRVERRGERGKWWLSVPSGADAATILRAVGRMPLPPYIRRSRRGKEQPESPVRSPALAPTSGQDDRDRDRYQTVYAANDGAVAAPTAGLHFTPELLRSIEAQGVEVLRVTLHVGYGTFAPLEVDDLADHEMHREFCTLDAAIGKRLLEIRAQGGRVCAVGTTSARVLESAWLANQWQGGYSGSTDLFCYPPYQLGGVDVLLTNFHLPRSTLMALVMSFAGIDCARAAYAHAIAQRYRFYSYGDAMLIL